MTRSNNSARLGSNHKEVNYINNNNNNNNYYSDDDCGGDDELKR